MSKKDQYLVVFKARYPDQDQEYSFDEIDAFPAESLDEARSNVEDLEFLYNSLDSDLISTKICYVVESSDY